MQGKTGSNIFKMNQYAYKRPRRTLLPEKSLETLGKSTEDDTRTTAETGSEGDQKIGTDLNTIADSDATIDKTNVQDMTAH